MDLSIAGSVCYFVLEWYDKQEFHPIAVNTSA